MKTEYNVGVVLSTDLQFTLNLARITGYKKSYYESMEEVKKELLKYISAMNDIGISVVSYKIRKREVTPWKDVSNEL